MAREECFKNIHEMNEYLKENNKVSSDVINQCVELLHSLRMLTIHVVEQMCFWKERLDYA